MMLQPKGLYNLVSMDYTNGQVIPHILEHTNEPDVAKWWRSKHLTYFIWEGFEIWNAKIGRDNFLEWDTRVFYCFTEANLLSTEVADSFKTHPISGIENVTGYQYINLESFIGDRRKICYACSLKKDRDSMDRGENITLYLDGLASLRLNPGRAVKDESKAKISVSNWSGSLSYPVDVVRVGNGGITKVRRDIYFTDHLGFVWWGVQYGNTSQLVHCKRMKGNNGENKRTTRRTISKKQRVKDRTGA